MFDALFKDASGAQKKLRLFWIAFSWSVHLKHNKKLLPFLTIALASLFGNFSRSGFSLFSPDFLYFALRIKSLRTSRACSVVRMEMRALDFYLSALIGSTFLEVESSQPHESEPDTEKFQGINPMAIPLRAQFSNFIGYLLCM
jgi:hypothetical protein